MALEGISDAILPAIVSGIITFIIVGLARFSRTTDTTLTHTVRVQNMEVKVTGFEEEFKEIHRKFNDIWERIDIHSSDINLHEYRLNKLDNSSNDNRHKSAV